MTHQNGTPSSWPVRTLRVRYLFLFDALLICLAVFSAIWLRFDRFGSAWLYLQQSWPFLLVVLAIRLPLYFRLNLYNRLWRYASMDEFRSVIIASALAPLLIALVNFGLLPWLGFPYSASRSIWLLEAICSGGVLAGSRLLLRVLSQRNALRSRTDANAIPTLIIGAGDAGAMILREIQLNRATHLHVMGFVDDDPEKYRLRLQGVMVLGDRTRIPDLVQQYQIQQVIIAMPTAPGEAIRGIVQICRSVGIQPKILPLLHDLMNGTAQLKALREVRIEDLLRRAPIQTDIEGVRHLLRGHRVLVTGGGGSIGSELCRQILRCNPALLVILGHGENSVFEIEYELVRLKASLGVTTQIHGCIADIRMAARMDAIFAEYRPHVVFHAAAHKHVPLMEANPGEAVTNNILGTRHLLQAAEAHAVDHFVMVSTDKAVNPTNVMGASKRAAELLVLETARRTGKHYVAVRFGNVLGSRGSVVLTFQRQIAAGGPVTLTHPEITRYFMTIPEAVQLVLQAAVLGHGGAVLMLDMGSPIRIMDLAQDLIRLSGLEVGRDIEIISTGLRPGEKLFEELFLPHEEYHVTDHPKIRIAANASQSVPRDLAAHIDALAAAAARDHHPLIRQLLTNLIPEYQWNSEHQGQPTNGKVIPRDLLSLPMAQQHAAAD